MKIAITSTGSSLKDLVDERFGRAKFFLIIDSETGDFEAVDNSENCNLAHGAGLNSVQLLVDKGVDYLITGHVGPKSQGALNEAKITYQEGASSQSSCLDVLKAFRENKDISLKMDDQGQDQEQKITRKNQNGAFKLAVPSESPGGLEAFRSGHFGRCELFTIVVLEDQKIKEVYTVKNPPHVTNGCMTPVNLLAKENIDAIIVGGIGARPLSGFMNVGIDVYLGEGDKVLDAVSAYVNRNLQQVTFDDTCRGH